MKILKHRTFNFKSIYSHFTYIFIILLNFINVEIHLDNIKNFCSSYPSSENGYIHINSFIILNIY